MGCSWSLFAFLCNTKMACVSVNWKENDHVVVGLRQLGWSCFYDYLRNTFLRGKDKERAESGAAAGTSSAAASASGATAGHSKKFKRSNQEKNLATEHALQQLMASYPGLDEDIEHLRKQYRLEQAGSSSDMASVPGASECQTCATAHLIHLHGTC
jgi:hypothetical protein